MLEDVVIEEFLTLQTNKQIDPQRLYNLTRELYDSNLGHNEFSELYRYMRETGLGPQEISVNLGRYCDYNRYKRKKETQNKFCVVS